MGVILVIGAVCLAEDCILPTLSMNGLTDNLLLAELKAVFRQRQIQQQERVIMNKLNDRNVKQITLQDKRAQSRETVRFVLVIRTRCKS